MTQLPAALVEHLGHPSLAALWQVVRERLERNGHAVHGTVRVDVDDLGADRLAGLLARRVAAGPVRIRLADLDGALRAGAAQCGLVAVVAALTGSPLRNRPAERAGHSQAWAQVWDELDAQLQRSGLAGHDWTSSWLGWLHSSGVVTRLGAERAATVLHSAAAALAQVAGAFETGSGAVRPVGSLGELASNVTGDAHGLDDGRPAAALVLRAGAIAFAQPAPASSADRRQMWRQLGVETDLISSSVLVWGLRPPGRDPWSHMMNLRTDQGLITYLTLHELRRIDAAFTTPDAVVHGCENPQVLQALADAGARSPLACVAGNPSGAAMILVQRVALRYHGDFDWPGIAIANRIIAAGAAPWRMGAADYVEAAQTAAATNRIPLTGARQPTPWDVALAEQMCVLDVAVHEESVTAALLRDLSPQPNGTPGHVFRDRRTSPSARIKSDP